MTLHPAEGPVPDPFFAAVRRRHPDVDLVLLPPEPPPPAPAAPGDTDQVRTDLETVRAKAEELGAQAAERLELGDLPGTVRACSRALLRTDETTVVDGLAAAAVDHGWTLRRHHGAVELLIGSLDGLSLRASHASTTGVLLVEVSGPDRPVGREAARELIGDRR